MRVEPPSNSAKAKSISPEQIKSHGLSDNEYSKIIEILGREPNITELGIFSVMWSEHCSYKSSKKWLKTLPTEAPWVICGPGENAGIIDIGDNQAIVFKMESHNHPSFIEPYQGAATGVGGILRDVFTMGARPIANMNSLRFGSPNHFKTQHLVSGVVAGIGGYGNCVGVPTVGGECTFHEAFDGNILVNAMTVGIAACDNIFYSAASGVGNPIVYVGSKTGRDGIHGATMASTEFTDDTDTKRPTVQVGDPFTEKLLIEACLELMATDCIIAIQDMGAAGLTSSGFEMASKGGMGVEMNLDDVPQREENMTAYEMMLSESQERMLMVLRPGSEDQARAVFSKWELNFSIIGKLTDTGHMVLYHHEEIVADLPIDPLALASPEYDEVERPWTPTPEAKILKAKEIVKNKDPMDSLEKLLSCPDLASKRWIWEQYDHMVMADTLKTGRPGGDAAVIRVHDTDKAIAITTDCAPRYCKANPFEGGKQAVAEAWRNLTAVGAKPLAITNCLNFGNPEKPEIMGQLVGCIEGMGEACNTLEFPVVSGNVSLYNETKGQGILPTPAIGGIGLLDNLDNLASMGFKSANETIILIGDTLGHLGQSLYLREVEGIEEGRPPTVDLKAERRNGDFVRSLIRSASISACHDVSDGGVLVSIAEMAMKGSIGATIQVPNVNMPTDAWLFGEDQARYLVTTSEPNKLLETAVMNDVPALQIGLTGGHGLSLLNGSKEISIKTLIEINESWLPKFMGDNSL
ncbi:MAG: phosphoribosylformylglycinamidine synthase subunit PurL [Pseudomonadota bacterium]|nr:phosphoribosylformylglycinamidine synthase subunit PurL [Pseudomonadota bacterium]